MILKFIDLDKAVNRFFGCEPAHLYQRRVGGPDDRRPSEL
jgi:hypothetical protein